MHLFFCIPHNRDTSGHSWNTLEFGLQNAGCVFRLSSGQGENQRIPQILSILSNLSHDFLISTVQSIADSLFQIFTSRLSSEYFCHKANKIILFLLLGKICKEDSGGTHLLFSKDNNSITGRGASSQMEYCNKVLIKRGVEALNRGVADFSRPNMMQRKWGKIGERS